MNKATLIVGLLCLSVWMIATAAFAQTAPSYFNVTYANAEEAVSQALSEKGAGVKIATLINGRKDEALFTYAKPVEVSIKGLTFDKPSGHFAANVLFVSNGEVVTATPVAGRFNEMIEIPTLKRQVRSGEIINAADVEIRDFPIAQTRSDVVTDMQSLIGKSPVRTISQYRPVRDHEIASPAVIKKNALITMRYTTPGMMITASGQALEDGSAGTAISVRNVASKKIVRAVVIDANTVDIINSSTPHLEASISEPDGEPHAAN